MSDALRVIAGASARERLKREGWTPTLFDTLVGASGGPKFLGIAGLDRFLYSDFLQRSTHPLHLIGSSIGSWRHAALASRDPVDALAKLQYHYLHQSYDPDDKRPRAVIVGEVCRWILDNSIAAEDFALICDHPRFISHVVTARGRGPNSATHAIGHASGMFAAALSNAVNRSLLQPWFQRVIFSAHGFEDLDFDFDDFGTLHVPLSPENAKSSLIASGSIPFLMPGERDIAGAPPGHYWDGGIVDYHFDFRNHRGDGLVLYPHFRDSITPGWFDKFLPWRGTHPSLLENVVLLCPSEAFLASLPHGKIPDRNDFARMSEAERVKYWTQVDSASDALGEAMARLADGSDPLAGVEAFPTS